MRTYLNILRARLQEYRLFSGLVLLILFFQACVIISFQIAYKEIFDGVAARKGVDFIIAWIVVILVAAVLRIVIGLLTDYTTGKLTLNVFGKIRTELLEKIQWLPIEFYQRVQIGDLISHYSHDLQQAEMVTRQMLPLIIRSLFLAIISFLVLFFFNWQLTLFALFLFPLVLGGVLLFLKKAQAATKRNTAANAALSSMMEEAATQHLLLQAFNLQKVFSKRFRDYLKGYEKEFLGGIFLRTLVGRTSVFGLSIVEILVFSAGALMAYQGMMTIGTLFGFFALIWNISGAVSTTSDVMPNLIEAGEHMTRLRKLLEEEVEKGNVMEKGGEVPSPDYPKDLAIENVSLAISGHNILKNISLEIKEGEHIGIVGSTGSGKTSFLSLLMGFYLPSKGKLLFQGVEIHEIDQEYLRSQMGFVIQQNPLFNLSIRENIRIGNLRATDEEIIDAAKAAEIHSFITSLPDGYDTLVKEYGTNLSGGQKQRLALARVYLRNAPLLLLDEPTSALDPLIESQIHTKISVFSEGKTLLLATHRLASLQRMDRILVFENGEIVETGNHLSLMKMRGTYFKLWEKQEAFSLKMGEEKPKIPPKILQKIPLFQKFSIQKINEIASHFVVEWRESENQIHESEYADKLYFIVRGRVEIRPSKSDPLDPPLQTFEEGDFFGGTLFLANYSNTTEVLTLSHCIFLTLHEDVLLK